MTRLGLKILTVLLTLLFVGDPGHAGLCQPASAPCTGAASKPMSCCPPGRCCCDLSLPAQPLPSSAPVPAVNNNGHEVARIASLPGSLAFFISNEHFRLRSAMEARTPQSAAVASYALTHAFLI